MIKHFIFGLAALASVGTAQAQIPTPSADVQALNQIQSIQKATALVDVGDLVAKGKSDIFSEELFLETLLAIPYEKRQYVFPAIHEVVFFGKKIKSHPEVIVWKGKKPTNIAPQLKSFAEKHLDNLNPVHYVLLDPEMWQKTDVAPGGYTLSWDATNWDKLALTRANTFYTMPDVTSFYRITPEAKADLNKVTLTTADVGRIEQTIRALPDFYASVSNPDETERLMRHEFKTEQDLIQNYAYPFRELVNRVTAAGEGKAFDAFIRAQGWATTAEFAEKSDTALKAVRAQQLIPVIAMQLAKVRKLYPVQPGEAMTPLQMYAAMYQVSAGNTLFMAKHVDRLRPLFQNEFFGPARMPIYLD